MYSLVIHLYKSLPLIIFCLLSGCNNQHSIDDAVQYAQEVKKSSSFTKRFKGIEVKRDSLGILTFDGKIASLENHNPDTSIYTSDAYTIVVYRSGKVVILKNDRLLGYAK